MLMGVLTPGSAHARPSAQPHIDTSGNFSASGRGGKKKPKQSTPQGQGGPPIVFFSAQILFILWVKTLRKISAHFCEKSKGGKEREKNSVNSGHLVPWQRMQAARTNMSSGSIEHSVGISITSTNPFSGHFFSDF